MTRFEWDPSKDLENQQKHGVAFAKAQYAFADPHRVIAEDVAHSDRSDIIVSAKWAVAFSLFGLPAARASFASLGPDTGVKER